MYQCLSVKTWVFLLWLILTATALYVRPLLPVDETRYAAVAWEMWLSGDFLVPHLNGELYSHKPPLLFWLMHLGWWLFGVNDVSPRLIAPLFALSTLYLAMAIARLLWPERKAVEAMAPFMLLGQFFWIFYSTLTMFDVMLTFFVLLGIYSVLLWAATGRAWKYGLLLGVAIGGGVLTKGPVILLHILPAALLAPWWRDRKRADFNAVRWYIGLIGSILLGAALALSWAIPAGNAGGEAYRQAIFFGQTQGRLVESFAHKLPWWWYGQFLPALVLPWLLLKPMWPALKTLRHGDVGLRFCAAWGVPVLVAFALISGKRAHYLLPLAPLVIMVLARALAGLEQRACDWRRANRWALLLFAAIGVALTLMPWLKPALLPPEELARLSPWWGAALLLALAVLWRQQAENVREAVFSTGIASVITLLVLSSAFFVLRGERFDTRATGAKIVELQESGKEVVVLSGAYHGEYQFGGRLAKPLPVIPGWQRLQKWHAEHPGAYALIRYKNAASVPDGLAYFQHRYKSGYIALVPVERLLDVPALKSALLY